MSMQSVWKQWLHFGNLRPVSLSSNSDKQTAHSIGEESSSAARDLKTKTGRELRTAASRPRLAEAEEVLSSWKTRWLRLRRWLRRRW